MLSIIMLNVIMLSVNILNVIEKVWLTFLLQKFTDRSTCK